MYFLFLYIAVAILYNMEIETFVTIKPTIQDGKLVVVFEGNNTPITELRVLKVADEIHKLLSELSSPKIQDFYFLFQVDSIEIPSNYMYIKEIAKSLYQYEDLIMNKLNYSVVQCKSNIFKMFFSLFKKYYTPVKELYLVKTEENAQKAIHNDKFRETLPKITTLLR